ncbi:lytic transglycosylase [Prevotella sp. oral taxon 376]|uniref:lytic transglycosylase domain-containing protein n=1 Tax=Prevotella sp. oral taxon 376 TaxID=712466 RepID=UPI000D1F11D8|nr:lytic transglycosylase domain-containing protein [Prevotella sp. oral taxon 376]PTL34726.1 lytic transglycosylase [Prevotella sp. oral taxon 376]
MKSIYIIIATMMLGSIATKAQNNNEIIVTNEEGKQEVIDLPEGMTSEFDSLMYLYNSKTYLKADTSCNLPDINPVYDKEVYKERLSRIPSVIEMPYNEVVQKFIDKYSGQLRRSVSLMLGAQNFYMPIFEQALETYGLPLELKYLPIIESALNPRAVSRVGATGLWQFMVETAKNYGLEINSLVDDRRDPVKSSYAAARYLGDLYKIFGDWNLVIAAYNCGPTNISKAIHRAGGEKDYWRIYPYLPRETRGYVPAFIAANYIMNYYCDHNICPMRTTLPAKTDTVMVNRDVHFEQIVHFLNVDINQLKELNPRYRRNIINGKSELASLRLPSSLVNQFIDNEDDIYAYDTEDLLNKRTEVEVNNIIPSYSSDYKSYSGNKRRSRGKGTYNKGRNKKSSRGKSITIKSGDTLSEIAARNHTTVSKLRKLNKIKGNNIRAGKKIKVK